MSSINNSKNYEYGLPNLQTFVNFSLSQQAKESIMLLQKYDRQIQSTQMQDAVHSVMEVQLKRILKLKTQSQKNEIYDNQLTLTALCNTMRYIKQLNHQFLSNKSKQQTSQTNTMNSFTVKSKALSSQQYLFRQQHNKLITLQKQRDQLQNDLLQLSIKQANNLQSQSKRFKNDIYNLQKKKSEIESSIQKLGLKHYFSYQQGQLTFVQIQKNVIRILQQWKRNQNWEENLNELIQKNNLPLLNTIKDVLIHFKNVFLDLQFLENNNQELIHMIHNFRDQVYTKDKWYEKDLNIKLNLPDILPNQHLLDMFDYLRALFRQKLVDNEIILNSLKTINQDLNNNTAFNSNSEREQISGGTNLLKKQLNLALNQAKGNSKGVIKQIIGISDNLMKSKAKGIKLDSLNSAQANKNTIESLERTIKNYQIRQQQIVSQNIKLKQIMEKNINQEKKVLQKLDAQSIQKQNYKKQIIQLQSELYNLTQQKDYKRELEDQIRRLTFQMHEKNQQYEKQREFWDRQKQELISALNIAQNQSRKSKSHRGDSDLADLETLQKQIQYLKNQLQENKQFYEQEKKAMQSHIERVNEDFFKMLKQQKDGNNKSRDQSLEYQIKYNELQAAKLQKQRQVQQLTHQLQHLKSIIRENEGNFQEILRNNKQLVSQLKSQEKQIQQLQIRCQQVEQLKSVIQIYKNSEVKTNKSADISMKEIRSIQDLPDKFNQLKIKYRREIDEYKTTITKLEFERQNANRSLYSAKSQLSIAKNQSSTVQDQISKLKSELQQKKLKVSELQIALNEQQISVSKLNGSKNKEYETIVQFLQQNIKNHTVQIASLKQQNHDLLNLNEQKNKKLQSVMSQLYDVKIKKQQQLKNYEVALNACKIQLNDKNYEIQKLKRQLQKLQEQAFSKPRQMKIQIPSYVEAELKTYKEQKEQLQKTLQSKHVQLQNKQVKIQSITKQLSILRDKNQREIDKLHEMLTLRNNNLNQEIQRKLAKAHSENHQLKIKINNTQNSLTNKANQLNRCMDRINELKHKIQQRNMEIQQAKRQKSRLNNLLNSTHHEKQLQQTAFSADKKKADSQIYQLTREKDRISDQFNSLQQNYLDLTQRNQQLIRQQKQLRNSQKQFEKLKIQISVLQKSLSSYKQNQQNSTRSNAQSLHQLQIQNNRLRQSNLSLDNQVSHYRSVISKKDFEISELKQDIIQLKIKYKQEIQVLQNSKLPVYEQSKLFKIQFEQGLEQIKTLKQNIFNIQKFHEEKLYELHKQYSQKAQQAQQLIRTRSEMISKLEWEIKSLNSDLEAARQKNSSLMRQTQFLHESNQKLSQTNKQLRNVGEENFDKIKRLNEAKNQLKNQNSIIREKLDSIISHQHRLKQEIMSLKEKSEEQKRKLLFELESEQRKMFEKLEENMQIKKRLGQVQMKLEDAIDQIKIKHQQILSLKKNLQESVSKLRYYQHTGQQKQKKLLQSQQNISKLREIAQMLDNRICEENASELNLLMIISQEIQLLIDSNDRLKIKCEQLKKNENDEGFEYSLALQSIIEEVIQFLLDQKMISDSNLTFQTKLFSMDQYDCKDKYFESLSKFMKELLAKVWQERNEGFSDYKNLIQQIKDLITAHLEFGDQSSLLALENLLKSH